MNLTDRKSLAGPFWVLALIIAAAAMLRFAQEFFLPLVLAGLLSFLLSTIAARALCKRLRARLPSARIIVGLWQPDGAEFSARRERLGKAGADETYPDLRRAAAGLAEFGACTLPPGTD